LTQAARPSAWIPLVASALAAWIGACSSSQPGTRPAYPEPRRAAPTFPDPLAHDAEFMRRHASIAAADSGACASCHAESECARCHDGRVRPRAIHPNDFLSLHAQAARNDGPGCASCHHRQSFCLDCHQRVGISESGPTANFAARGRFHPPSSLWSSGPRTPAHHAWEAQRNLSACVSCHQERDCVACHATRAVGGPGGGPPAGSGFGSNPHPAGFRSDCARALGRNPRPCLVCHDPADPELLRCQ
jgi:hypothetical protein